MASRVGWGSARSAPCGAAASPARMARRMQACCVCDIAHAWRAAACIPERGLWPVWPVAAGVTKHSRPEPLYFWGYFVLMNFIWIVVPGMCLVYCITNINRSVAANKALVPAA